MIITYRTKDRKRFEGIVQLNQQPHHYWYAHYIKERCIFGVCETTARQLHLKIVRLCAIQDLLGARQSNVSLKGFDGLGYDHSRTLHINRKPFVLDAPYSQSISPFAHCWLNRDIDFYFPGHTYPRITALKNSPDIDKLAEIINGITYPDDSIRLVDEPRQDFKETD